MICCRYCVLLAGCEVSGMLLQQRNELVHHAPCLSEHYFMCSIMKCNHCCLLKQLLSSDTFNQTSSHQNRMQCMFPYIQTKVIKIFEQRRINKCTKQSAIVIISYGRIY